MPGSIVADRKTQTKPITVDWSGAGTCRGLAEAVRRAAPGAVLLVLPGTYDETEAIVTDQPIEIQGDGPAEQIVVNLGRGLRISADARISNLTLTGRAPAAESADASCAIHISRGAPHFEKCVIRSETASCLGVEGVNAQPTLRNCRILDSADSGLIAADDARAVLEDCEIAGHSQLGLLSVHNAEITITGGVVAGNRGNGILARDGGRVVVRGCEIHSNALAGVVAMQRAVVTLAGCTIRDGQQGGVYVRDGAEATLDECHITANAGSGIEATNARISLRRCRVTNGRSTGVDLNSGALGMIAECQVSGNRAAGVSVRQHSEAQLQACILSDGHSNGLTVLDDARATATETKIIANAQPNIGVARGGRLTLRKSVVSRGRLAGLLVTDGGRAELHDCEIAENRQAGIDVNKGSEVELNSCRIRANKADGLILRDGTATVVGCCVERNGKAGLALFGLATIEDSDLHDNAGPNVEVVREGRLTLRACRVCRASRGVFVHDKGRAMLLDCQIVGNAIGVDLKTATAVLTGCAVQCSEQFGIRASTAAELTVEDCDLTGNSQRALFVEQGCKLVAHRNRE